MAELVVLLPVYRNQTGLERSLDSLQQAHASFDVLVIDDGSPQPMAAPSYLRADVKVSLIRLEENRGIAAALNHGVQYSARRRVPYVGRLDAGDTIAPDRFDSQIAFLDAHPECAAVSSFVDFVDADRQPVFRHRAPREHSGICRHLRLNNCLLHPASMIRASALQESGLYREDAPGAEDYELFLRLSRRYKLAVLPEVLTCCEYSPSGLSISGRRRQQKERLKLQLYYFDPTSLYSFLGVARTLLAMVTPYRAVFRYKQALGH